MIKSEELMRLQGAKAAFLQKSSLIDVLAGKPKKYTYGVNGIDLAVHKGEIVSLVGESGSGKTTTGRMSLLLMDKSNVSGDIIFEGKKVNDISGDEMKAFRQKAQMIFQDPYQSLNPKDIIQKIVAEPLVVNGLATSESEKKSRVMAALEAAGLKPAKEYMTRFPHELSGGQRQRVAIAAALTLNPLYIVADEPVSMLDVSIRADILKMMVKVRDEQNISYLFITHDLSLAWMLSDRVAIMYLGKILEIGSADDIIKRPVNPYSKALIDAMTVLELRKGRKRNILKGDAANPLEKQVGCVFAHKCPRATDICHVEEPLLQEMETEHFAACHHPE